jgi:hypothetical protein
MPPRYTVAFGLSQSSLSMVVDVPGLFDACRGPRTQDLVMFANRLILLATIVVYISIGLLNINAQASSRSKHSNNDEDVDQGVIFKSRDSSSSDGRTIPKSRPTSSKSPYDPDSSKTYNERGGAGITTGKNTDLRPPSGAQNVTTTQIPNAPPPPTISTPGWRPPMPYDNSSAPWRCDLLVLSVACVALFGML